MQNGAQILKQNGTQMLKRRKKYGNWKKRKIYRGMEGVEEE